MPVIPERRKGANGLRRGTLVLALVVLAASLMSFLFDKESRDIFALIYFVAPLLWALWILCAVQGRRENIWVFLLLLWGVIDLSLFTTLSSLASSRLEYARGTDLTILIAYFPVLIPIVVVHGFIPDEIAILRWFTPQTPSAYATIVWVQATCWSFLQSVLIYLCTRRFSGAHRRR